ncbi:PucR family transcriptional regulator [Nocardioides marmoriginsengisoli]|uniref:PucR family transcriptional regulator n=1 Tax=Nocardioides marmoriginsengisoli TaxID=661483 RepID=A0A3N0CHG8_9ACTN|nr:helix-turn-helix domain-containing protein [Nocardioides marmoriginsengisoli]RNL62729.1 PucR family transcriptional regulator [Nocardioides marmoriginsengisoli]
MALTVMAQAGSAVDPGVVEACRVLAHDVDRLTLALSELIASKEPYYVTTLSLDELMDSVRPNVLGILDAISCTGADDVTAAPCRTGRLRAAQGAPLGPVQRAYRIGMSFIWEELVRVMSRDADQQALLRSATSFWNTLDLFLETLSRAYREFEAEQIQHDSRTRDLALTALFHGTHSAGLTISSIAAALRLPTEGAFVVIATDPVPVGGERAMVTTARSVTGAGGHVTWRSDPDGAIALIALSPRFTLDRLLTHLATLSLGRIGVSEVFTSLQATSGSAAEARAARGAATLGSSAVLRYGRVRVAVLLASESDVAEDLFRDVLGGVIELPEVDQTLLLATLRAWFEAEGSTAGAAAALHCHPNTVRYRLGKVSQLTGRSLTAPIDTAHLYLAMEFHRILAPRSTMADGR